MVVEPIESNKKEMVACLWRSTRDNGNDHVMIAMIIVMIIMVFEMVMVFLIIMMIIIVLVIVMVIILMVIHSVGHNDSNSKKDYYSVGKTILIVQIILIIVKALDKGVMVYGDAW